MKFGCFGHFSDVETIKTSGFDFIELDLREIMEYDDSEFLRICNGFNSLALSAYSCSWILPLDVDLTVPSLDTSFWLDYLCRGAKRCRQLNVQVWPFGCGRGRSIKRNSTSSEWEQKKRVNDFIAATSEICAENNIVLALEPLGPANSNYIQTLHQAAELVRQINQPNLRIMCDLRHMHAVGDPINRISKFNDIIAHCHIDRPIGDKRLFPSPSDGYNYNPYLYEIRRLDCGHISFEAINADLKDAAAGLRYVKSLF